MPQIVERIAATREGTVAGTQRSPLQTATSETAQRNDAGAANATTPEKSSDAQRLAQLAAREKAVRREAQRLAAEKQKSSQEAKLQGQLQALQQENTRMKGWVQRFYRNPVEVLNEAGVPGDVITQGLLNQPSREAVSIRALQHKIAQIEEQNKSLEAKLTEGQQAQYDQAKSQIRSDAKALTLSDEGAYEAIKAHGDDAIEAVVELIEQTFDKDDRLMSVKEAADEVEAFLIEEAAKLAGLNKVKEKLGQSATLGGQQRSGTTASSQGPTTLSNRGLPAPAPKGRRSDKERVAAAIQAFEAARVR